MRTGRERGRRGGRREERSGAARYGTARYGRARYGTVPHRGSAGPARQRSPPAAGWEPAADGPAAPRLGHRSGKKGISGPPGTALARVEGRRVARLFSPVTRVPAGGGGVPARRPSVPSRCFCPPTPRNLCLQLEMEEPQLTSHSGKTPVPSTSRRRGERALRKTPGARERSRGAALRGRRRPATTASARFMSQPCVWFSIFIPKVPCFR